MTGTDLPQNEIDERSTRTPAADDLGPGVHASHYAHTTPSEPEHRIGSVGKIIVAAIIAAIITVIALEVYFLFFEGPVGASAHRDQAENSFYVKSEPLEGNPNELSD